MTARTIHGLSLAAAAKQIGTTRHRLLQVLKSRGLFHSNNLPRSELIQAGLFVVQTRAYHNRVSGISKQYAVTLVTGHGLSWLQDVMTNEQRQIPIPRCPDTADAVTGRDERRHRPGTREVA